MKAEEMLKVTEAQLKTQRQSLDLARRTLSKRELSTSMVISSVVANPAALFKNHLPNLDVEILYKYFTVDDAK
jgi:fructose-bisphosphate aldolase class 1